MDNEKMTKEQKEQNAIVAANMQINGAGIEVRTLQDAKLAAETFIASGLVPSHFNQPSKVIVALIAGRELGFGLWQSLQNLHVVNGQIGIKSAAIGGLIRSRGRCKSMKQYYEGIKGEDDYKAIVESQRVDDHIIHRSEFSIADAKQAGLWGKDNWKHYPDDMLMWRALSRHGRTFYGDVLSGLYTVEELQDLKPEQDYLPDTPKRGERKQVESQEKPPKEQPQDNMQLIADFAKDVFGTWLDKNPDLRIADHDEVIDAWSAFCADKIDGDADDYWKFDDEMNKTFKLDAFNEENLNMLKSAVDELIDPPQDEPKPQKAKYVCSRCGKEYQRKPKSGKCSCLGELKENE